MKTPELPDRRSDLLSHALRLFTEHGYEGIGVQQIVEAAGVTKPTLYHHFGSKLGLLEALLSDRLAGLDAALVQAADYGHDLTLTLTRLARVTFIFAREQPAIFGLARMLSHAPPRSEAGAVMAPFRARQLARLEQVFLLASADHGNMTGRHRVYAISFQGMLDSYAELLADGGLVYDEHLVYRAVHHFMHGIFS